MKLKQILCNHPCWWHSMVKCSNGKTDMQVDLGDKVANVVTIEKTCAKCGKVKTELKAV